MPVSRRVESGRQPIELDRRVIALISEAADLPESDITPAADLASLGMQSLEKIECVLNIEDAFEVELDEPDLWRLKTVGDVIAAVRKAVKKNAGHPPS